MKKRWISGLMLAVLLMGMLVPTAAAQQSGKLIVSDAAGKVGETVEVTVSLVDNPGVIALAMKVHYDPNKLELVSVDNNRLMPDSMFSQNLTDNPYYASWSDSLATENFTDDGVLMVMHFRILEDCEAGNTKISLTYDPGDLVDWELKKQSFSAVSGTVIVEADEGSETNEGEDKNGSENDESSPDVIGYNTFYDLEPTGWYRSYVEFMLKNGYMYGMSTNEFAPNGSVTRGQLVTILYRIAGSPDVSGTTNPFKDVEIGKWYTDAVIWAAANGIVNGVTTETFAPNNNITREQLATILYRYDGAKKSGANDLSKFADSQTVSAYAVDAMNWAVGTGIMNGSDGKLLPAASASRVQTAAMLSRYVENETIIPVPTDPTVSDS